ncbi:type III secretion system chaperone [Breoghania sp. JC706]|uniref:type III secretion system chaperone n=1 Tax=Breoghania sp. JC706 TaxID=3117732 RepID=UPI0030080C58
MTSENTRFADYVTKCCEVLGLPVGSVDGDSYMFQVGDRWIELKANGRGDLVTFAAMVYMAPPDVPVRADLVCGFNVHYLFDGGFSLLHDRETERLYLCRAHRLETLDPRAIRDQLIDFADRAANVGTWYIRSSEETAPARPPVPSGAEPGSFLGL